MPPFVLNIFLFAWKQVGLCERMLQSLPGLFLKEGHWVARGHDRRRLPHWPPLCTSRSLCQGHVLPNQEKGDWRAARHFQAQTAKAHRCDTNHFPCVPRSRTD